MLFRYPNINLPVSLLTPPFLLSPVLIVVGEGKGRMRGEARGMETGKDGWRKGSEGRGLHMVMCRPPCVALPL